MKLGFRFEPSMTSTYWSTQQTQESFVRNILWPYFEEVKETLNLPATQYCLWKIDCWSVHRKEEFQRWLKKNFPYILVCFVPAGCTGLFQPLDVGIQRVLKQSMKLSAHRDVVAEATSLLSNSTDAEDDTDTEEASSSGSEAEETIDPALLKLDTTLGTLRNRCTGWIVDAFHACNRKELILKVHNYFLLERACLHSRSI
jgi:hypothetical protein